MWKFIKGLFSKKKETPQPTPPEPTPPKKDMEVRMLSVYPKTPLIAKPRRRPQPVTPVPARDLKAEILAWAANCSHVDSVMSRTAV
jgi:hypothetical protein